MAIIGAERWSVDVKLLDVFSMEWPEDWTQDAYAFVCGQGYLLPSDDSWANRPTGTQTYGGMLMGFPRSAEALPPTPGAGLYFPEYVRPRGR